MMSSSLPLSDPATPSGTVRFAVVGLGYIGRRHAELLYRHPQAELSAVVEPDRQLAQAAQQWGLTAYSSLSELLASEPEVEVATLCTPNALHCPQALEVLAAGRHVVVEKPMGLSRAACLEVVQRAEQAKREVFVVKQNRFTPIAQWLRGLVRSGKLGPLVALQLDCFWNRGEAYYRNSPWKGALSQDGGTLYTQFSHFLDLLVWLFGVPRVEHVHLENRTHQGLTEIEDYCAVRCRTPQGAPALLHFSTSVWDQNLESRLCLIGERGSVVVGGQYMNRVDACRVQGYTMPELAPVAPPNDYGPYQGSAANHHYVFQNVVDTLAGRAQPAATPTEGANVVGFIEDIYRMGRAPLS